MTIFEKILKVKKDHPDILDVHLIEDKDFLERKYEYFINDLKLEYKDILEKVNLANLDTIIPIFVLMKALNLDEISASTFNEKTLGYDKNILKDIGFKENTLTFSQEGKKQNEAFSKKIEDIFYFTMIDFAKDVIEKIDVAILNSNYAEKNKLQQYIFSLVEDKEVDFYLKSLSTSHKKIIESLNKSFN